MGSTPIPRSLTGEPSSADDSTPIPIEPIVKREQLARRVHISKTAKTIDLEYTGCTRAALDRGVIATASSYERFRSAKGSPIIQEIVADRARGITNARAIL
uniref:Uncharacterized protein n=1 Tax=Ananas comosus var. bracteatus TaxID=296719 RepID=A0A6V7QZD3_ANACO